MDPDPDTNPEIVGVKLDEQSGTSQHSDTEFIQFQKYIQDEYDNSLKDTLIKKIFENDNIISLNKEIILIIYLFIKRNFNESEINKTEKLLIDICYDIIYYLNKINFNYNKKYILQDTIQLLCIMNISDIDLSLNPSVNIEKNKLLRNYYFIKNNCKNLYLLFKKETITKIEKEIKDRKEEEGLIDIENKKKTGLFGRFKNYINSFGRKVQKPIEHNAEYLSLNDSGFHNPNDREAYFTYDSDFPIGQSIQGTNLMNKKSNAQKGTGGRRTKRRSIRRRTKRRRMRSRRR